MNHRPAIYHPKSAENIKRSILIAYNGLSDFQSLEYASARCFFLRGLCLTEKPSQTHPFKRDQPSLCLSCRAGQPQKCVPLQGFRLQTVVVLVVFLYTKIELRRIVTRHVSGNHKACLNGKQSSSSSFQSIIF